MENDQKHFEDLSEIRSLMERSSKFISLSGISGIIAGLIAFAGAFAAWWYLHVFVLSVEMPFFFHSLSGSEEMVIMLSLLSIVVFISALAGAIYFTTRSSRKKNIKIWDLNTKRLLFSLFLPLAAGAFFIFALIYYGLFFLILPSSLIFYGLSLINGSNYTYSDIKFLGYFEIILGAICLFLPFLGLYIWAFGFGVMHIIYGIVMYFKYER